MFFERPGEESEQQKDLYVCLGASGRMGSPIHRPFRVPEPVPQGRTSRGGGLQPGKSPTVSNLENMEG